MANGDKEKDMHTACMGCGMCSCGHHHHWVHWVIKILVVLFIFWAGMEFGEVRAILRNEYSNYGYGGSVMIMRGGEYNPQGEGMINAGTGMPMMPATMPGTASAVPSAQ